MPPVNATIEYTKNAVMTASRSKLVVLMYEGAQRFVEQARFHLQRGNHAACGTAISNAYNVLSELKVALDFEAGGEAGREIATNLDSLYVYMMDTLVEANVARDVQHLEDVLRVLGVLKEGWEAVLKHA